MKTLFKIIAWIVGIIIVLMVVAGIIFKYKFNPNNYKQQIIAAVKSHTGRDLEINGSIDLSLFPWLGVEVRDVKLGNPAGFSDKTFAQIGDAQVKIQMFPMLFGDFKISKIILNDTTINLTTLANGRNNWGSFSAETTAKAHKKSAKKTATKTRITTVPANNSSNNGEFSISNIDIDNANIHINNAKTGHNFNLTDVNLKGSNINFNGDSFSIKASFNLAQTKPLIAFNTKAQATISIGKGLVDIDNLTVSGKISDYEQALKTPVPYALEADKIYAHDKNVQLKSLSVELANFKVTANLNINSKQQVNGSFSVPNFNPSRFISALGLTDAYKNANGLTSAQASATIKTKDGVVSLSPFNITVDNSKINAQAQYNTAKKDLNFALDINKIDLNNYMTNDSSSTSSKKSRASASHASSASSQASTSVMIPRKQLQAINWHGTVHIGELKSKNFALSDINITTNDSAGDVSISPITANLYKGLLRSNFELNARDNPAKLNTSFSLSNVQLGQLVYALTGKTFISGTANFNTTLASSGNSTGALKLNLSGNGRLRISNGDLKGFDLDSMIRQANAFLTHKKTGKPKAKKGKDTQFSSISASYTIKNGVINNNNLLLLTPYAQANGTGSVDLRSKTINYQLSAGPKSVNGQQAWNFPISITGPIAKPTIVPNMGAVLGQVVKDALGNLIKKALGGDNSTANTKSNNSKQKNSGKQLQNLFNGLFHHK